MRTRSTQLVAASALALASVGLVGLAATAANAAPSASSQDQTFVTSNAQSNLAEIALGKLGEQRGQDAATHRLAAVTLSDHTKLQAQLTQAAKSAGLTVPSTPNAMQQAVASQLMATPTSAFDLAYAQAEVTGHQMALAVARTESTAGSNTAVVGYDKDYIPIAAGHLDMATTEVSALSGSAPGSVSAGTGGGAQTDTGVGMSWELGAAGALLVAAGSGAVAVTRRRRRTARS